MILDPGGVHEAPLYSAMIFDSVKADTSELEQVECSNPWPHTAKGVRSMIHFLDLLKATDLLQSASL